MADDRKPAAVLPLRNRWLLVSCRTRAVCLIMNWMATDENRSILLMAKMEYLSSAEQELSLPTVVSRIEPERADPP